MTAGRFRKIPVEVLAVFFDGENFAEVEDFAGDYFRPVDPEDRGDDPDIIAEVWDYLHGTWVGVKARMWIIRGVKNELYPCEGGVFAATYEVA